MSQINVRAPVCHQLHKRKRIWWTVWGSRLRHVSYLDTLKLKQKGLFAVDLFSRPL